MGKRRVFTKTIDCQRALYQIVIDEKFECYSCGNKQYYLNRKDYSKMCTMCKSKTMVTRDTIFHNLRFKLLKGFKILDEMEKSNYELTSIGISKKYGITQTTAWKFQKKIKNNKDFVGLVLSENIGRRKPKTDLQFKKPTSEEKKKMRNLDPKFEEKYLL